MWIPAEIYDIINGERILHNIATDDFYIRSGLNATYENYRK